MRIISARSHPEMKERFISYFQLRWSSPESAPVYRDCITASLGKRSPLPQWYLLMDGDTVVGCAGLITNDFISRMDLWPWLCALYIEEKYRGFRLSRLLIDAVKEGAKNAGFDELFLCTGHVGFYEKFGFSYIGDGFHPWGESSRIYRTRL
ncbi:MAG: GNAT family N-acetyltransferase [Eubacteriales bacterium]|nr:GNAT family N-acetyltransferase [Eubacteriales bacterium]MDD3882285.1 GNAT family N-acetyltransferase [Eubacteriales bacterium]MDD4512031.1 GNAT family N-acetyltransferase [Eubacteriales bacterium]